MRPAAERHSRVPTPLTDEQRRHLDVLLARLVASLAVLRR
ncbi:hypothetical protein J2S63_000362 [Marmoricola bigeumensis]|uniref:MarR family transcriptional regulator n=1 Tax=Nocardioides marmoribigeumensis TaxID=433649 RepID=A0ABU2BS51_9ACTN|nr:hypothetical protein [Nocardioides marmoribigeumensis]